MLPALSAGQWLLGVLCALFVGVAKTGVPGLGILVVPLMVVVTGDARLSAGWLLPLLSVADVFAVFYYRRHAAVWRLFSLAPWVALGMGAGALALGVRESMLRPVVGGLVLVMIGLRLRAPRGEAAAQPDGTSTAAESRVAEPARSASYGLLAGFATTVANAAGPVMSLYLLARRLPKTEFIATGAWFFLVINLCKLPVYVAHGLVSGRSLAFDAVLVPAVIAGALFGRALFRRIPQRAFELAVLILTAAAALLLIVSGKR